MVNHIVCSLNIHIPFAAVMFHVDKWFFLEEPSLANY